MINYDAARMGVFALIQWRGSVFPKALRWAVPNVIAAVLLHLYGKCNVPDAPETEAPHMSMEGVNWIYASYTSILGFLVVFRNNQAYTRFWEGAKVIHKIRGEWFNAVSTLFAFSNHADEFSGRMSQFQNTLVRLVSMLYCSALHQVCDLQDDALEVIEASGLDKDSIQFMKASNHRCEIILQWIQRLIVEGEESKTIKIAPPLLTRAYQELSRGIVDLQNAKLIHDVPLPFPYAQMITFMMLVHWMITPLIASQVMMSTVLVAIMCFVVTFCLWCLIYIGRELDQPYGEDANDLPLKDIQQDFNQSLLRLMDPRAQKVPHFEFDSGEDARLAIARRISLKQEDMPTGRSSFTALTGGMSRVSKQFREVVRGLPVPGVGFNNSPEEDHVNNNSAEDEGNQLAENPEASGDAETRALHSGTSDAEDLRASPVPVGLKPKAVAFSRPLGTHPSKPEPLPLGSRFPLQPESARQGRGVRGMGEICPSGKSTAGSCLEPTRQVSQPWGKSQVPDRARPTLLESPGSPPDRKATAEASTEPRLRESP